MLFIRIFWKTANKLLSSSATTCNIRSISRNISEKDKYSSWLAQNLNDPVQVIKHTGLFWKDFILFHFTLFHPYRSIINCNLIAKLKEISFIASECTPLVNISIVNNLLQYVSTTRLSSFCFNEEVILKIINALYINEASGYDDLSIWMMLCSKFVVKPLSMIFKDCIETGTFRERSYNTCLSATRFNTNITPNDDQCFM